MQSSGLSKGTEKQKETDALAASAQAEGEIAKESAAKESAAKDETEKTWILKESSTESNTTTTGDSTDNMGTTGKDRNSGKRRQQPMEQEVPELPVGRIAPHPAVPLQIAVRHPLRM